MISKQNEPVSIRILDTEYLVGCPVGTTDALLASARRIDTDMRTIRNSGKVIGTDRIAVMVALNLAHELLELQQEIQHLQKKQRATVTRIPEDVSERLDTLRQRIDNTLDQYGT